MLLRTLRLTGAAAARPRGRSESGHASKSLAFLISCRNEEQDEKSSRQRGGSGKRRRRESQIQASVSFSVSSSSRRTAEGVDGVSRRSEQQQQTSCCNSRRRNGGNMFSYCQCVFFLLVAFLCQTTTSDHRERTHSLTIGDGENHRNHTHHSWSKPLGREGPPGNHTRHAWPASGDGAITSTSPQSLVYDGDEESLGPWPWAPAPIRHWWATHHHQNNNNHQSQNHRSWWSSRPEKRNAHKKEQECLRQLQQSLPADSVFRLRAGADWAKHVCAPRDLDERVRRLLRESPCEQHRVCQVLSPKDLQKIASDSSACVKRVELWWRRFHAISRAILDFELVFTTSLDIDLYSIKYEVEQCKVRPRKTREKTNLG